MTDTRGEKRLEVVLGDGFIRVEPFIPPQLTKALTYYHRILNIGNRKKSGVSGEYRPLYSTDFYISDTQEVHNYLITMPGFRSRIEDTLTAAGYPYTVRDVRTPPPPMYIPEAMYGLRGYQYETVLDLLMAGGGLASCPTGFGKTYVMAALIRAFHHDDLQARNTPLTVLSVSDKDVARKNYEDLCQILPGREIGLVMSGKTKWSDDIQVITMDSLHRIDHDSVGIFIADEVHTAATEKRAENISKMRKALKWGVSATPDGRFDGGDITTEGLFGPLIVDIPYSYGVEVGALVPITVYYLPCPEPACGMQQYNSYVNRTTKVRHGIEGNIRLNKMVAEIINQTPDEHQLMAIMPHLRQMNNLRQLLPGIPIVHGATTDTDLTSKGYMDIEPVSVKERDRLYQLMNSGEIRKILATYVYKQGVNFPNLNVMICPGGGGSKLVSGQIPGRASRRIAEKDAAYIVDFVHPWDYARKGPKQRKTYGPLYKDDKSRAAVYDKLGFKQVLVTSVNDLPFVNKKLRGTE